MTKELQTLLSERSVDSQNRIQKLAEKLFLETQAYDGGDELKVCQNELEETNPKKPS